MKHPHAFQLLLVALLIGCVSGCAERGDTPPRIDRLGSTSSETRNHSIRVATANLWGVSVLGFDWAEDIDARFAEFAERLARNEPELDVVLIQEAWKNSARRALLRHEGVIRNFPYRVDTLESPGGAGALC